MARKGEKLSDETRKKLSESLKGRKTWNKGKKYSVKNRGCSVEGCDKPHHGKGFCVKHYMIYYFTTNPEKRAEKKKRDLNRYYKNYEENKARKRKIGKSIQSEIVIILGGKCVSCDEKFNSEISRSNMHIHHKFYSDKDIADLKRIGVTGHHWEIKRLIKNNQINELKKKFTLLCRECNQMEKYAKKNGQKTFDFFCWLYGENYFDQALKDDPKLKKLSEFMK